MSSRRTKGTSAWMLGMASVLALVRVAGSGTRHTASGTVGSAVPLYENRGGLHHPIAMASPKAQPCFDQGLRLVYALHHEEAIHSFE